MRKSILSVVKFGAFALVAAALVYSSSAVAKRPGGGGGTGCPRDIACADIYDPVICDDGQIYGNACYAFQQCATGCVPYGDGGPIEAIKKGGGGGGDIQCPDVWDPVICSDGQIYSNGCYASVAGATGCVPYGDVASIGKGGCPRDIGCPDVYDPVTCSNGVTYPNACYAYRACATGCGSGGGGGT